MAVLIELFVLDIIAWSKGATGTYRVIISKDVSPERAECRVVPDFQNSPLSQIAEYLGLHLLRPAAGIAEVAVPEEIAGGNIAVPGDESTPLLDEMTATRLSRGNFGET